MSPISDIREYKNQLRTQYKAIRKNMTSDEKCNADTEILQSILKQYKFINCETVITYVSTPIEVDTRSLITYSIKLGKKVAVPRCVPNTREMEFYYINSLDELSPGSFGVDEPCPERSEFVIDFSKSICIVPALSYDRYGYRLGYGGGYYDRFLSKYGGYTIGVCYDNCINKKLIHGRYDRATNIVITDKQIIINRRKR